MERLRKLHTSLTLHPKVVVVITDLSTPVSFFDIKDKQQHFFTIEQNPSITTLYPDFNDVIYGQITGSRILRRRQKEKKQKYWWLLWHHFRNGEEKNCE